MNAPESTARLPAADFTRRPDEEPSAWLERLLNVCVGDLTNEESIDLARHIREAQAATGVGETPPTRQPEAVADSFINVVPTTPGGPLFIHLKGTAETVRMGPYANPDLAHKDALKIRAFLADVVAEARR